MKLYLSSYFLGNNPAQFAELFAENKKVAIIMNAGDSFGPTKRPDYLRKEVASLARIGLEGEELDLRDYFNDQAALAAKLQQYGGVWVMGGNSFVLRRAMRQSGFDQVAAELAVNDRLVYGGFSAGAVVASKTLEGIELIDDPEQLPGGYEPKVIWEGLRLYERSIAPHYKSDHPESAAIDKVVAYFEKKKMPYVALRDGEAIVVRT
ncbi:MAG TPA: Type 1 glutamine amidotransferase-like domain-containing protein [Candidatus Saccharimonadales bacterium]|jgi:dipeptidase E|nr:Type 1 glutamine amidotransferase-like domain-containing protein [Candidatus Saccharimonadales bacterium]